MPLVELDVIGDAPLEHDVAVLGHARQLAGREVVAALAVLDDVDGRVEPAGLVKRGPGDAVDFHQEVEVACGIDPLSGLCHGRFLRQASLTSLPPAQMPMRTMMNSAGYAGRMPISM
jgi:hypothetical protein